MGLSSLQQAWADSDGQLNDLMADMEPVFSRARADFLKSIGGLSFDRSGLLRGQPLPSGFSPGLQKQIIAGLGDLLPSVAETISPVMGELGISVPDVSRRAQLTFLRDADRAVSDVLKSFNKGLAGLFQQAASTPISPRDMAKLAGQLLDAPLSQARTISSTALAGLQRRVASEAAGGLPEDEGGTWWIYLGPDDDATRPFCRTLVGLAVSDSNLLRLKNGQGLPVRDYGGGYNCRHSLTPVTVAYLDAARIGRATDSDISRANQSSRQ